MDYTSLRAIYRSRYWDSESIEEGPLALGQLTHDEKKAVNERIIDAELGIRDYGHLWSAYPIVLDMACLFRVYGHPRAVIYTATGHLIRRDEISGPLSIAHLLELPKRTVQQTKPVAIKTGEVYTITSGMAAKINSLPRAYLGSRDPSYVGFGWAGNIMVKNTSLLFRYNEYIYRMPTSHREEIPLRYTTGSDSCFPGPPELAYCRDGEIKIITDAPEEIILLNECLF